MWDNYKRFINFNLNLNFNFIIPHTSSKCSRLAKSKMCMLSIPQQAAESYEIIMDPGGLTLFLSLHAFSGSWKQNVHAIINIAKWLHAEKFDRFITNHQRIDAPDTKYSPKSFLPPQSMLHLPHHPNVTHDNILHAQGKVHEFSLST